MWFLPSRRFVCACSFLGIVAAGIPAAAQQAPVGGPPSTASSARVDGPPYNGEASANITLASAASPSRLPNVSIASSARVTELEQRLAQVEAQLANQTTTASTQAATPASGGAVVGADVDMIAKWNNGFEAQTKDKVFRAKFGGQLQFDYTDYRQSSNLNGGTTLGDLTNGAIGPQNESVDFRRLRLRSEGTMYENIGWVVQPDFSNAANVSNVPGNPPDFAHSLHQGSFAVGQTLAIVPTSPIVMSRS